MQCVYVFYKRLPETFQSEHNKNTDAPHNWGDFRLLNGSNGKYTLCR